ncbi:hypothetical protein [Silvimonas sp.]|uniref:hypothetical protein n=1 Tax=Silvimonas sp. TaxID=2650811 RepID=UPI00284DD028|nr:hypothetical protein [Silvimonas sp.]MDR3427908.1 hypothetical protein [Silvimonas sp.]
MPEEIPESTLNTLLEEIRRLNAKVDENTRITSEIRDGFPGGDADGHRRYHEEVIEQMAEHRKLRKELITHLVKTSTWVALSGAAWTMWKALQSGLFLK